MAIIYFSSYLLLAENVENDNKMFSRVIFKFLSLFFKLVLLSDFHPIAICGQFLSRKGEKEFFSCQLHLSHWFPHPTHAPNGAWNEGGFAFAFVLCQHTSASGQLRSEPRTLLWQEGHLPLPDAGKQKGRQGREGEMHSPFARPGTISEHDPLKWAALQKMKSFIKSVWAGKLAIQVERRMTRLGKWKVLIKGQIKVPYTLQNCKISITKHTRNGPNGDDSHREQRERKDGCKGSLPSGSPFLSHLPSHIRNHNLH